MPNALWDLWDGTNRVHILWGVYYVVGVGISGAHQKAVKNMGWLIKADGRINASVNKVIRSLIKIMACRLFSAKPLSESILAYFYSKQWEQV